MQAKASGYPFGIEGEEEGVGVANPQSVESSSSSSTQKWRGKTRLVGDIVVGDVGQNMAADNPIFGRDSNGSNVNFVANIGVGQQFQLLWRKMLVL